MFGKLKVKRAATEDEKGLKNDRYWLCECDCKEEVVRSSQSLNDKSSCNKGKCRNDFKDYTGQENTVFKIIKFIDSDDKQTRWLATCKICEQQKVIPIRLFQRGTTSCGCKDEFHTVSSFELKLNEKYRGIRRTCKERNWPLRITIEELKDIVTKPCTYCGFIEKKSPKKRKNKEPCFINSCDRVNSNKNYTISNIQPICEKCNHAKKDHTHQEMKNWIKRLKKYRNKKN